MLAVCGGKGGVGKTTTAVGLGAALAAQHRETVVLDADAEMPNLHAVADTPAEPGVDALARGVSLEGASHATRWQGLVGVPATPGADVRGALRHLVAEGPVLLDCPGGGGRPAAVPLRAADAAVVVTTPRPPAVRDAVKTAAMARELGARVAGIVVNRADGDAGVGDAFEAPVLARVPAATEPLAEPDTRASYGRLATRVRRANV